MGHIFVPSEENVVVDLAGMLGIGEGRSMAPLRLVERIGEGLPVSSLDRVAQQVAPGDRNFRYRVVPRSSLARRQHSNRLTAEEGARLARLANIWGFAREVWKDDDKARRFLFRPHMLLEDRLPIDVALGSELGAELVKSILGGLLHGTAL